MTQQKQYLLAWRSSLVYSLPQPSGFLGNSFWISLWFFWISCLMFIVCVISPSAFAFFIRDGQREWMEWAGLSVSLLCILHCTSLSLSTVFLSVCQLYFFHLFNCISLICQLYFFQFMNCISFICSTVFLSLCQLYFFQFMISISFICSTVFLSVYELYFQLIFK